MSQTDIILLSIALAMDCFAVSIASGFLLRSFHLRLTMQISIIFGLFQALMPLAGWWLVIYFSHYVTAFSHWIAFALLAFIGGKMIIESFKSEESHTMDTRQIWVQLLLGVATSIDALAVGVSFSMLGYTSVSSLTWPLLCIGLTSFLFGIIGHAIGSALGQISSWWFKPELVGGIILLAIGIKILVTHSDYL